MQGQARHQKKFFLTETMQNVHNAFILQNPSLRVSYSSFCGLHPFYITPPRASNWKTCQYHENAKLMFEFLKSFNAVETSKLEESCQLVCCSPVSESCFLRTCLWCQNKYSGISPEQEKTKGEQKQWKHVEKRTEDGAHFHTKLEKQTGTLSQLMIL